MSATYHNRHSSFFRPAVPVTIRNYPPQKKLSERSGAKRSGQERSGAERSEAKRSEAKRSEAEWSGLALCVTRCFVRRVDAERSSAGSEATARYCVRLGVVCDGWTRSEAGAERSGAERSGAMRSGAQRCATGGRAAKRRLGVVCNSVLCGAGRRGAKLRACVRGAKLRAMSEAPRSGAKRGSPQELAAKPLVLKCNK